MATFRSAALYAALVLGAGTVLGTLRTLFLAPRLGTLPAVLLEIPVMLVLSWACLALTLKIFPLPPHLGRRTFMGMLALALLLFGEFLLGYAFAGTGPGSFLSALGRPEGLAGLAAQIIFAAMPALDMLNRSARMRKRAAPGERHPRT